ncbi:helix-turn-helix transcriptional regulator [Limosilactobacillus avistercoris]|uniref:helix-turn-helix transcriptional regulator n=1 Tax=Limosilactobacillus avistercoris TaxID=2762243 RepID=UPI001CD85C2D|nr:helix-turn-helix transcriptional regulator [Limosilactobacillus avistercoris]
MIKNNIKALRLTKHLSQEQLAEKAKVSVRTIQRLEAGEDASISTLNLVAGALGVEVGDLFPRTDSAKQQEKFSLQMHNFNHNCTNVMKNLRTLSGFTILATLL